MTLYRFYPECENPTKDAIPLLHGNIVDGWFVPVRPEIKVEANEGLYAGAWIERVFVGEPGTYSVTKTYDSDDALL